MRVSHSHASHLTLNSLSFVSTSEPGPGTDTYNFAVTASDGGDVTVNGELITGGSYNENDAPENKQYELVLTPNAGYRVSSVKVNGVETALTGGNLNVTLTENKMVAVVFEKVTDHVKMSTLSLSKNTSFYQTAVSNKELKVWGYDTNGMEVDLTGSSYLSFDSNAPWIFDVTDDGKLSSGTAPGSALLTATYHNPDGSMISGSVWMARTEITPVTFGITSAGSFAMTEGFLGHDGSTIVAGYKKDAVYNNNYLLRAYTGRVNAPGDWYTKGLRAMQGWFYDDGVSNSGFYIAMQDSEYYNPDGINKNFYTNSEHNNWSVSQYPIGAFNNSEYYVTGQTGSVTEIPRTVGWHQVMTMLDDEEKTLFMYLDGTLVASKQVSSSTGTPDSSGRYGDSCFELRSTQGKLAGFTGSAHSYDENHYFDNMALFDAPKSEIPQLAPVAKKVVLSGAAMVGQTMNVTYEVVDYNNDELDAANIQWQVSDDGATGWTNISGATQSSYVIDAAYLGKYIRAGVTPYAKVDPKEGKTVYSASSTEISVVKEPPSVSGVSVTGAFEVGNTLTASYTYVPSAGGDSEGNTEILWEMSDSPTGTFTEVAKGLTYVVNSTLAGKYLRATVIPKDINGLLGTAASSNAKKIPGNLSYYVSLDGDDNNNGSFETPFLTLEKARDTIRGLEIPDGGVTVYVRGGTYYLTKSFSLTSADSGREGAPIVYRNYGDEEVILHGGYDLDMSKFTKVSGTMKDLLPSASQSKVLVASLADLGLPTMNEYAVMGANGGLYSPLFNIDGQIMHLSRYPNTRDSSQWPTMYCSPGKAGLEGTNLGNGETDATLGFTVKYDNATAARVNSWTYGLNHLVAEGYWKYDWYASTVYVTLDKSKNYLSTRANEKTNYGVAKDMSRVFCFKNVYQELDEAGEYYVDFDTQMLYIYPFEGTTSASKMKLNKASFNLIEMSRASYITIKGFELTSGKAKAINMTNGIGNVIDNCYINGFQSQGINMLTGSNNVLKNSHIEFCGSGGVVVTGGDKDTITHGKNLVDNNEVNDFGVLKVIYSPGIHIGGIGNTASHNAVYNSEHYAIYYEGVDNVIEYNKIHNACTNAADMGAIYTGRHFDDHGTIIRYNHFYDIGNPLSRRFFPCAIFTDDGSSDLDVYGNVFGPGIATTESVKIHGGQNNNVYHNLIIDAPVVLYMADWADAKWRASLTDSDGKTYAKDQYWNRFDSVRKNPLYRDRWPWIAIASDAYDAKDFDKIVHYGNMLAENLIIYVDEKPEEFVRTGSNPLQASNGWWRAYGNHAIIGTNDAGGNTNVMFTNEKGDNKKYFVDFDNGDYRLKDNSLYDLFDRTDILGKFEPIPFDNIGQYDVENHAPIASSVSISGDLAFGNTLSGLYDYNDPERDPEGSSTYRWLVSDSINGTYTAISGATGKTFTVDDSYRGKFLKFEVTPASNNGGKGLPVVSSAFAIAADKTALNQVITAVEAAIANVKVGSALGEYTSDNVDKLQAAVDAAKEIAEKESPTVAELTKAANDLSNAYADFNKTANNKETTANNTTKVTAGLSDVEIVFTGSQNEATVNFEGVAPKTSISFRGVNITIPSGTVIPNGTLKISLPDNPSIFLFGDLTNLVKVGETGDVFNNAIRIELAGKVSQDVLRIGTETYELITRTLEADQASSLGTAKMGKFRVSDQTLSVWTKLGGEYAVASLIVPSQDAMLKNMQINGKEYAKFRPETTSYKYVVPSTATELPVVTAQANDENATVVIDDVTAVPGTATITVTAQDLKSKMVYTVAFSKISEPSTPPPTTSPTHDDPIINRPTGTTGSIPNGNSGNRSSKPFTDIIGHWAEADINEMYQKDIVSGISDTLFDPDRNITRVEFAALVTRALGLKTTVAAEFTDVNPFEWYYNSVNAAAAGLIAGHDGYFRPNDLITREEMAVVIMKAYDFLNLEKAGSDLDRFIDKDDISDWAKEKVGEAVRVSLISGISENIFAPHDNATRAQAASLIKRLLDK